MPEGSSTTGSEESLARGRAAARSMSDKELHELHGQGASGFRPGTWQILDDEVRRRERVRSREVTAPAPQPGQYPALRASVALMRLAALIVLVASVGAAVVVVPTSGLTAFLILVGGTLAAVSYWAGAELLVVLMDIEANTRSFRSGPPNSSFLS